MDKCCVCGEPAPKRCAKCKSVSYCSADHQKSHWKAHKTNCQVPAVASTSASAAESASCSSSAAAGTITTSKLDEITKIDGNKLVLQMKNLVLEDSPLPYSIQLLEDGEDYGGLFMFAARDLKPGDVILQECPIVLCPILSLGLKDESLLPCWGCFKSISDYKNLHRCRKCGLSLCSAACEYSSNHKFNECQTIGQMKAKLKGRGLATSDEGILRQYLDVCVLRLFIQGDRDPKIWEYFRTLENSSRSAVYLMQSYCGPDVLGNEAKALKLSMTYSENTSENVIFACNVLNTFWTITKHNGKALRALYCYQNCIQHDCVGNTFAVQDDQTLKLTLMAATPIQKGELITYDFLSLGHSPWASTSARKRSLLLKNIICTCLRCSDQTEFGTFCAQLRCSVCENGVYVEDEPHPSTLAPGAPENFYRGLNWKCNQPDCDESLATVCIDEYLDDAKREYDWAKAKSSDPLDKIALNFYNNMCLKYKKIGANHFLILQILDDYLEADRIKHETTNYLRLNSKTKYTEDAIVHLRRKKDFSGRLVAYLDKVKKDCIHDKRCQLFIEYGFYNLVVTGLDYSRDKVDKSDLVKALQLAVDLWGKARDMLKFLPSSPNSWTPDYKTLADTLYMRFSAVSGEEELMIPFLMAELQIEYPVNHERQEG